MTATFADLGLPDSIVNALERNDIDTPFPVQAAAIPDALADRDVCGKAPTGSGKTLAFGLPILTRVPKARSRRPASLILTPTRELAAQIRKELAPYAKVMDRQVFAVFGGVRYQPQKDWLNRGVDVLVATPGRLEDLIEQGAVDLSEVGIVAIDEADRMADMGFLPAVRRILDQTATKRQTLLFSATLDGDVAVLMRDYQSDPVRHDAATEEIDVDAMEHHFWQVERTDKVSHVADVVNRTGPTMVFTRTRHGADRLAKQLVRSGIVAEAMHGGRSQNQRNRALAAFVSGSIDALVATDVAARGIHIDGVATVVHFDPPNGHKDYLHRSGRTARAGARGTVVSLVTSNERRAVNRIKKSLELDVPTEQPHRRELPRTALADRARAPRPVASAKAKAPSGPKPQARQPVRKQRPDGRQSGKANGSGVDAGTVVVTNLPWSTTDKDVRRLLGSHGTVTSTEIKRDRRGRSKGVAVVKMDPDGAARALRSLEGRKVGGRRIEVRMSRRSPRR